MGTSHGSLPEFLAAAIRSETDACIIWPFASRAGGYGAITIGTKRFDAHRLACMAQNGPAPEGSEAAHSCGTRSCVNPRHLRWATRAQNAADKIGHGRQHRGESTPSARLTDDKVRAILTAKSQGETMPSLARRYGVRLNTIQRIIHGRGWRHIERSEVSDAQAG